MANDKITYPPDDSSKLSDQASSEKASAMPAELSTSTAVAACPLLKKYPEDPECKIAGVSASVENWGYTYSWDIGASVQADSAANIDNYIEVIAGLEKPANISVSKKGMAGPCTKNKHSGNSWYVEGGNKYSDSSFQEKLLPKKFTIYQLKNYFALKAEPNKYVIRAISCSGNHQFNALVLPDTEFELSISFTVLDASDETDADKGESTNEYGQSATVTIKINRNQAEAFSLDLINWDNKSTNYQKENSDSARSEIQEINAESDKEKNELAELYNFQKYKQAWDLFHSAKDSVFGNLERCKVPKDSKFKSNSKMAITFLKIEGEIKSKWQENPGERTCSFHSKGSLKIDPIIQIEWQKDITTYFGSVGAVVSVIDKFLKALEMGEIGILLKVSGKVGLDLGSFDFNHSKTGEKEKSSKPKLNGKIGFDLNAFAKGNIKVDKFGVSCGAEGSLKLGLRSFIGDTDTVYSNLKSSWEKERDSSGYFFGDKDKWKKKLKNLEQYEEPESRESTFDFEEGLVFNPKVGWTGLQIYYVAYLEMSCSISSSKPDLQTFVSDDGLDADLLHTFSEGKSTEAKIGTEKGSKDEKSLIHIGGTPVFWQGRIEII